MELEQLRIFLAVAECKSFTRAAKKLYISHSTTSRAVSGLEQELGVCLFLRDNKIFSLTKEGEYLKEKAGELIEGAEKIREEIKNV